MIFLGLFGHVFPPHPKQCLAIITMSPLFIYGCSQVKNDYWLIVTKSNLINLYRYNGRRNSPPSIRSYKTTFFTLSEVSLMHQTKYRGIITKGRIIDVFSLGTSLLAGETS